MKAHWFDADDLKKYMPVIQDAERFTKVLGERKADGREKGSIFSGDDAAWDVYEIELEFMRDGGNYPNCGCKEQCGACWPCIVIQNGEAFEFVKVMVPQKERDSLMAVQKEST